MPSKRFCCVVGCTNSEEDNPELTFYRFPGRSYEAERKQKWIEAVGRITSDRKPWQTNNRSRVCSSHFVGGQKSNIASSPSYIPTIFPFDYEKKPIPTVTTVFKLEQFEVHNEKIYKSQELEQGMKKLPK